MDVKLRAGLLQHVYTVAELSRCLGISKARVETMLKHARLVPVKSGNKGLIFSSQLCKHLPELWQSLCVQAETDAMYDLQAIRRDAMYASKWSAAHLAKTRKR